MRKNTFLVILLSLGFILNAQDWKGIPVPANPGQGKVWQLQTRVSDDFNYVSSAGNRPPEFTRKWYASYHGNWSGPGKTQWRANEAWTNGSELGIQANRVPGTDRVYCGIITNKTRLKFPVYFEIEAKIMDQTLANAFWLLSPDDTQEIDAMEGYGSSRRGQEWFAERMHVSHHVFIRNPFQDYQPTDPGSWIYRRGRPWRNDYHRYGCYWKDPWNLEYYIDGVLVRTVSGRDIIDPRNYTNGTGLNKAMDIIIDCENQTDWRPGPTDAELNNNKNIFWVDWMRVYKPVDDINGPEDRQRSITFDNRSEYIPSGKTDPVFDVGQDVELRITYQTEVENGVEEDLSYAGILTRQVDENGGEVASSEFLTIVPDDGPNQATIEYNYTIPTTFTNGQFIPPTSALPNGHRIVLVIFSAANNTSVFVDATDTIIINDHTLSVPTLNNNKTNISVFPNPTSDYINIKGEYNSWVVYTISGKKLIEGDKNQINMSNLSNGVYYISFDDRKQITRFVKN